MRRLFAASAILLLIACEEVRNEYSTAEAIQEDGVVQSVEYTPAKTVTSLSPSIDFETGSISMHLSTDTIPEKFIVNFRAEAYAFTVDDKQFYERYKNHVGQKVILTYGEKHLVTYRGKDDKREVVSRQFVSRDLMSVSLK